MLPPHPIEALKRIGASEIPSLIALVAVLLLQAAMLISITRNFLIAAPKAQLEITTLGIISGSACVIVGVMSAVIIIIRHHNLDRRRRSAEVVDLLPSLRTVPDEIAKFDEFTGGVRDIELAYNINYDGYPYTVGNTNHPRIVLTPIFGKLLKTEKKKAITILAHEYSHLEVGTIGIEQKARTWLKAYFVVLASLLLSMEAVLSQLVPKTTNTGSVIGLLKVVMISPLRTDLIQRIGYPLILVLVTGLGVFVLSYFWLIRRELIHDRRAAQITCDLSSSINLHTEHCASSQHHSFFKRLLHWGQNFLGCHPSPCERKTRLQQGDFLFMDISLYPFVMGLLIPSFLLALGRLNPFSEELRFLWNIPLTIAVGLFLFLIIRADIVRFAASWVGGFPFWKPLFKYAMLVGIGSGTIGWFFWAWYLWKNIYIFHMDIGQIHDQFIELAKNTVAFGIFCWTTMFFMIYACALRLISGFEKKAVINTESTILALFAISWFIVKSLPIATVNILPGAFGSVVLMLWIICLIVLARCPCGEASRFSTILLCNKCRNCGRTSDFFNKF